MKIMIDTNVLISAFVFDYVGKEFKNKLDISQNHIISNNIIKNKQCL